VLGIFSRIYDVSRVAVLDFVIDIFCFYVMFFLKNMIYFYGASHTRWRD
jgi:hypothetical protein